MVLRFIFTASLFLSVTLSAEYKFEMKGVKVELLSELTKVKPGSSFRVAIFLKHFDDFHTYWKNPGLVGFATQVEWNLPPGFKAGELIWQVPERSKMLKYNCHAYKGDTYLLTTISVPETVPDKFEIKARIGGMSCSTKECCKIGFINTAVELQKSEQNIVHEKNKALMDGAEKRLPKELNEFKGHFEVGEGSLKIRLSSEDLSKIDCEDIYFYSDKNITDTESEQVMIFDDEGLLLEVKLNKYAVKEIKELKGLLYNKKGWGKGRQKYLPLNLSSR